MDLGAQNSPNLEGFGFSKIRTPKSILCFLASYWGIPIFSIRDSGKLLGEFERTRSFLPTSYWGYPI